MKDLSERRKGGYLMKNLTELLKDIPLEEMTGGLDMSTIAENKTETNVMNSIAKIKNKASAAVAIAACAVVAVAGAIHYRGNDIQKHGASNDSNVTTDAQDQTDGIPLFDDCHSELPPYFLFRFQYIRFSGHWQSPKPPWDSTGITTQSRPRFSIGSFRSSPIIILAQVPTIPINFGLNVS